MTRHSSPRRAEPGQSIASQVAEPSRSLLIVPRDPAGLDALLGLGAPLAETEPPRELIVAGVVASAELGATTAALAERRDHLMARGIETRTAAFSSPTPGDDVVRLASQENVELLVVNAGSSPLDGEAGVVLQQAPCDVAMLVEAGGAPRPGPVIVPFGAAWHDWAALELGAWVALATEAPLRLIGAASDGRENGRDASRLLADASLIVQRQAGVVAEPLLASPGRKGLMGLAEGAGLLVVGLSEGWRQDGPRPDAQSAPGVSAVADGAGPQGPTSRRPGAGRYPQPLRLVADCERGMTLALEPGATFGGYRVESLVGRGGMGVVYRAIDLSLERPVALKLIAPELAEDERFRERFLREPRLAASLDHPNVIPIYEAGEHDGQLYLAMRYVEGSDLKAVLEREGKLGPERALAILAQVAGALDAAHRRALVHRDVKPANVLLDEDAHVYLTDFGITKQLGGASTDTGRVVGTLDYLAPEQIRGDPVDGRTDSYALACVLYECLSGKAPFHRETEAETMWAHMQEQPAPLRTYPRLEPVLKKALAKEREERYGSCAELIDAASDGARPGGARPPRRSRRPRWCATAARSWSPGWCCSPDRSPPASSPSPRAGTRTKRRSPTAWPRSIPASGSRLTDGDRHHPRQRRRRGGRRVGCWAPVTGRCPASILGRRRSSRPSSRAACRAEIAAGEGAVWVGNAGGEESINTMVSVSRIDPGSSGSRDTVKFPGEDQGALPTAGLPRIAVGAGAVWAINPDGSVSRIDPKTGRLVAKIDARGVHDRRREGRGLVPGATPIRP